MLYACSLFPAGLAKPWVGNANGEAPLNYNADAKVIDPTGLPALHIVAPRVVDRPLAQLTALFEGKAGFEHTFSIRIKGARDGYVLVPDVFPLPKSRP